MKYRNIQKTLETFKYLLLISVSMGQRKGYKQTLEHIRRCAESRKIKLDEKQIKRKYISGLILVEIANQFNCSRTVITRILKENNIPIRTKSEMQLGDRNHRYGKRGELSVLWKGDDITYRSLHKWVNKYKPKSELCEYCKKNPPYDLANIDGKYKRNINDYIWLCRSCHMKSDGRLKKLLENHLKWRNAKLNIVNKYLN